MTEHGKARRNRQRDLNSFQDILHRKNPRTIVAGLLLVNMAPRFKTPLLRKSEGPNIHKNIERMVAEIVEMMNGLNRCIFRLKAASDSGSFRPPIPVQSGHRFRLNPVVYWGGPESEAALDNLQKMGQDASFERRSKWPERGYPCARFERC
jgi:hypothetical protein